MPLHIGEYFLRRALVRFVFRAEYACVALCLLYGWGQGVRVLLPVIAQLRVVAPQPQQVEKRVEVPPMAAVGGRVRTAGRP